MRHYYSISKIKALWWSRVSPFDILEIHLDFLENLSSSQVILLDFLENCLPIIIVIDRSLINGVWLTKAQSGLGGIFFVLRNICVYSTRWADGFQT